MAGLKITVRDNFTEAVAHALARASTKAEHKVATQVAKDTSKYVPYLTGSLDDRTQVDGGYIIYPGPYARYLYYGRVMVYPGPPVRIVRPDGKAVLTHFGQKKVPIEKPLKINTAYHPKAQSHWFEASKAQNLDKWLQVAEKAVKDDLV